MAVSGSLNCISVGAGQAHSMAIDTTGAAYCWGINTDGQLGNGANVTPASSPTAVVGGLTFTHIAAGDDHNVALASSGAAYCWGRNPSGKLGTGDATPRSSPTAVIGGLTFIGVSAGGDDNWGFTIAGDVYGWGANSSAQLGINATGAKSSPTLVVGSHKFVPGALLSQHTFQVAVTPGTTYTLDFSNSMGFTFNGINGGAEVERAVITYQA